MDKAFYLLIALVLFGPVASGFTSDVSGIQKVEWPQYKPSR